MNPQEKAFREAFESYSDGLFRHAFLRLSDRERAVELVQDCFLRTWEYLSRGGEVRQYQAFLYRTLGNLIIDEYRKKKTQSLDAMLENEETAQALEGEYLRDETNILENAMSKFDAELALRAVKQLPEEYRAVVLLRYLDGFTPSEIAEQLGEDPNTVSVRLHRALRKLRAALSSHSDIQP